MNSSAPLAIDVVVGQTDDAQPSLPLASDGVRRWVWQSKFGAILIEVVGPDVFINGQRVEAHAGGDATGGLVPTARRAAHGWHVSAP